MCLGEEVLEVKGLEEVHHLTESVTVIREV